MSAAPGPTWPVELLLYRELLEERDLYKEARLDELPERLGALLGCPPDRAIAEALAPGRLEAIAPGYLRELFAIRDMEIVSRTPAAIAAELKRSDATYEQCCRTAIVYGVAGLAPHAFSALRAAAARHDDWARHHYLYGLILAARAGDLDRARWELDLALAREPYQDGRERIDRAIAAVESARAAAAA